MKKGLSRCLSAILFLALSGLVGNGALLAQSGVVISSPSGPVRVRGSVLISGTATNPSFNFYKVEYAPGNSPREDQWVTIGSTHATPVQNGLLETWHTQGAVPDGVYSLRLRVVRRDGNYDEYVVRQITVANAQPTETATPAQTSPASRPTAASATPQAATATIVIEMPNTGTPAPKATTSGRVGTPTATPSSASVSLDRMGSAALYGAGIALGLFVLVGLLALVRYVFRLIVYRP